MCFDLEKLYHQQMMQLTQKPQFLIADHPLKQPFYMKNPLCGDWVSVGYLNNTMHWHGEGCLIHRASIEALSRIIDNKNNRLEIIDICTNINQYFAFQTDILPDDFQMFASVRAIKPRIQCVTLSTKAVIGLIKKLG